MTVRIGVIGTGGIAERHLSNLSRMQDVQIASLCDINEARVNLLSEKYSCDAFTDYRKMLKNGPLDLLLICTPPGFRREAVEAAAALGVPCFIEKPPAIDVEESERIATIIGNAGMMAGVGFMYRYAGAIQKAKELIAGQAVPLIRSIYVCGVALNPKWPRWFFNKSISGGPILDQAIHILDASRYIAELFAGDVVEVNSFGSNVTIQKSEDFTIEDTHVINLKYKNGTIQSHSHSWAMTPSQVKIELLSKDYHLIIDLNPEPGRHRSRLTGHLNEEPMNFDFTEEDFYVTEMRAFVNAVKQKNSRLIRSPYSDAAQTLKVVFAANQSVEEGGTVVLQPLPKFGKGG